MTTLMPVDSNANPIPALRFKDGGAHHIAAGATATANATPFDSNTSIISIYATVPVFLQFGDETVSATSSDHYFPAGVYYDVAIGDDSNGRYSHVSVLRVDQDGDFYVTEKF